MATDEQQQEIRDFIHSYNIARSDMSMSPTTEMKAKFSQFCQEFGIADDALFIRPSGNAATPSSLLAMLESEDIKYSSMELQSIDSIRLFCGGNGAVVTFTQHDRFEFKGKSHDDICKFTLVLEKGENEKNESKWKIVHSHRGPGHPPVVAGQKRKINVRALFM